MDPGGREKRERERGGREKEGVMERGRGAEFLGSTLSTTIGRLWWNSINQSKND